MDAGWADDGEYRVNSDVFMFENHCQTFYCRRRSHFSDGNEQTGWICNRVTAERRREREEIKEGDDDCRSFLCSNIWIGVNRNHSNRLSNWVLPLSRTHFRYCHFYCIHCSRSNFSFFSQRSQYVPSACTKKKMMLCLYTDRHTHTPQFSIVFLLYPLPSLTHAVHTSMDVHHSHFRSLGFVCSWFVFAFCVLLYTHIIWKWLFQEWEGSVVGEINTESRNNKENSKKKKKYIKMHEP